jgi:hypothetical protein
VGRNELDDYAVHHRPPLATSANRPWPPPPSALGHLGAKHLEPETHKVDPESGSTLRLLSGFAAKLPGQLANFGSTL